MQALKNRVLYVSEDESTRELLTVLLARRGYHVVNAPSLVTALLAARGQPFNLYLIDAQFWGGEGLALCRTVRVFDPLSPIILFSSDDADEARQGAFDAGATVYVLKPDIERLIEAVGHVTCDLLPHGSEQGAWSRP